MDTMVFQFVGETVTAATNKFLLPSATNLIAAIQALALIGVTLYITLIGYAVMTGAVEAHVRTFMKQSIKIIIIAFFALTVDGYADYVLEAIDGLEVGLSGALSLTGDMATIYEVLDNSLQKGLDVVSMCFQKADEAGYDIGSALGWAIAGVVVAIGTTLISVLGGAENIVAKFALSVMLVLGPIFILALMFPITARFFDSWFSQVLNYVFTIVIMAIIMAFSMTVFDSFIDATSFDDKNPMFTALEIGAISGVLCWIILQASSMASGLAGGLSMTAMGIRHLAMPVTGGLKGAKGVGDMVNPVSTRRDMQSGMMVSGRRADHLMAGNSVLNPAYRQQVLQNFGKNWGRAKGGKVKK